MKYALLKLEQYPGAQMQLQLQGDPATVCQMIANGMAAKPEVAAAFTAAVVVYAKEKGLDCGELGRMIIM